MLATACGAPSPCHSPDRTPDPRLRHGMDSRLLDRCPHGIARLAAQDSALLPRVHGGRVERRALAAAAALHGLRHRAHAAVDGAPGFGWARRRAARWPLRGGRPVAAAGDSAQPRLHRGALQRVGLHRPPVARRRADARLRLLHRPGAADGLPDATALVLHVRRGLPVAALGGAAHERERLVRAHQHARARRRHHRALQLPRPLRPDGRRAALQGAAPAPHQELLRAAQPAALLVAAFAAPARALGRWARAGALHQRRHRRA
mmetsp:Transcript_13882/g.32767  ORF Transcript_13882/g.32767 Transcript_13882/m.32767 type:complete len:262 (-) Transcript_13882:394-1179(-)